MQFILATLFLFITINLAFSQVTDSLKMANQQMDSIYIAEVEDVEKPVKILHAEPLYIDLIRDLGARKGEKEWNFAFGLTDNLTFDTYQALIEYEFAPVDRLGFEIELPFTIVALRPGVERNRLPSSKLESLKLATQWSFFVSEKMKTSMAVGYIHEFEFSSFDDFGNPLFMGNIFNPFLVVAKRFQNNFHTLIYTGPRIGKHIKTQDVHVQYDINTNFHYMISGTRNFIGVEFNKTFVKNDFDMIIRPQIRLGVMDNLLIGIVTGIPIERENQRFSMFTRIIWEPGHKH